MNGQKQLRQIVQPTEDRSYRTREHKPACPCCLAPERCFEWADALWRRNIIWIHSITRALFSSYPPEHQLCVYPSSQAELDYIEPDTGWFSKEGIIVPYFTAQAKSALYKLTHKIEGSNPGVLVIASTEEATHDHSSSSIDRRCL